MQSDEGVFARHCVQHYDYDYDRLASGMRAHSIPLALVLSVLLGNSAVLMGCRSQQGSARMERFLTCQTSLPDGEYAVELDPPTWEVHAPPAVVTAGVLRVLDPRAVLLPQTKVQLLLAEERQELDPSLARKEDCALRVISRRVQIEGEGRWADGEVAAFEAVRSDCFSGLLTGEGGRFSAQVDLPVGEATRECKAWGYPVRGGARSKGEDIGFVVSAEGSELIEVVLPAPPEWVLDEYWLTEQKPCKSLTRWREETLDQLAEAPPGSGEAAYLKRRLEHMAPSCEVLKQQMATRTGERLDLTEEQ